MDVQNHYIELPSCVVISIPTKGEYFHSCLILCGVMRAYYHYNVFCFLRPSFERLAGWLQSISSSLTRGLAFPKDLLEEIRRVGGPICTLRTSASTDEHSLQVSTYGSSISRDAGGGSSKSINSPSLPVPNSSSFAECSLSSSCSSMSTFAKIRPLHSICEVDHSSSNNNSMSRPALSSPES